MNKVLASFFPSLALFSALFIVSCSQPESPVADTGGGGTLRARVDGILGTFEWADELEPGRLTENVSFGNVSSRVRMSNAAAIAELPSDGAVPEIVPAVPGFAALDLSGIPRALMDSAVKFFSGLSGGGDVDSFMASGCLFSLALFYEDGWDGGYGSFVIGRADAAQASFEIPVRFFSGDDLSGTCDDVRTSWILEGNSWKVDGIRREGSVGGAE
ncbi:hypothetical protein [Treponema saccharophilum]|nr:hypothetical protein [Treponema saccharophilum]